MKKIGLHIVILLLACFSTVAQEEGRIVAEFTIDGSELPIEKSLVFEEDGLLIIEFDKEAVNGNINAGIKTFLSKKETINKARIDFPGKTIIRFHQRYNKSYNKRIKAKVKLLPSRDILEPNDEIDQATPIGFHTWYQCTFFPDRDNDFYSLNLKKPFWIYPVYQNSSFTAECSLYDKEGNLLTKQFPFYTEAGDFKIRLNASYGESSIKPFFFKMVALPESDELEPNDKQYATVLNNKTYRVNVGSKNDKDLLSLATNKKGYAIFRTIGITPNRIRFRFGGNSGNPLIIPADKGDIVKVQMESGTEWTNAPFLLDVGFQEMMDPNEPNDSISDATSISKSEGLLFSLYNNDQDWFQVETNGPSKIILNIFDVLNPKYVLNYKLDVELYDANQQSIGKFKHRETEYGAIFTSPNLGQSGTWYLKLTSSEKRDTEQLLGMKIFGTGVSGKSNKAKVEDIYFIGMDLDSSAFLSLQSLSESGDIPVEMADSSLSLNETMTKVFTEAKSQKKKNGFKWTWLLVVIGLLGLVFILMRKKKSNMTS